MLSRDFVETEIKFVRFEYEEALQRIPIFKASREEIAEQDTFIDELHKICKNFISGLDKHRYPKSELMILIRDLNEAIHEEGAKYKSLTRIINEVYMSIDRGQFLTT